MKAADHGDGGAQGMYREIRVVVKVTQYGDGEAIHSFGPARQEKLLANGAGPVGREQDRIPGDREGSGRGGGAKKLASCSGNQRQTKITLWASTARTSVPPE